MVESPVVLLVAPVVIVASVELDVDVPPVVAGAALELDAASVASESFGEHATVMRRANERKGLGLSMIGF